MSTGQEDCFRPVQKGLWVWTLCLQAWGRSGPSLGSCVYFSLGTRCWGIPSTHGCEHQLNPFVKNPVLPAPGEASGVLSVSGGLQLDLTHLGPISTTILFFSLFDSWPLSPLVCTLSLPPPPPLPRAPISLPPECSLPTCEEDR